MFLNNPETFLRVLIDDEVLKELELKAKELQTNLSKRFLLTTSFGSLSLRSIHIEDREQLDINVSVGNLTLVFNLRLIFASLEEDYGEDYLKSVKSITLTIEKSILFQSENNPFIKLCGKLQVVINDTTLNYS